MVYHPDRKSFAPKLGPIFPDKHPCRKGGLNRGHFIKKAHPKLGEPRNQMSLMD